jgi:dTMP kinase
MDNKKGLFIAFEGIDGSGKSTQIRKLVQHIFEKNKHHNIVLTRNPYKDVVIRKTIVMDNDPSSDAEKLASLFIADRRKQTEEIIKPNLENGHFVLSDRYKLSTIAYQTAQGLKMEELIDRQKDLPKPDMTFIIDVSAEESVRRMEKEDVSIRGAEHKFESHKDFTEKLRENYYKAKEIMEKLGYRIFVIDGHGSPEKVFERVKEVFDREFKNEF